MKIKHGEIGEFVDGVIAGMSDGDLVNRTDAITKVSKAIDEKYPGKLYRESRRSIAAHHIERERKRRKLL